jgi:WD40 repeat protein
MKMRDTGIGMLVIATLVAAGAWYAKDPDSVHRSLSHTQLGAELPNPRAFVHVNKVWWTQDSRKLLSVARGEVGFDGPLVLHDLDHLPCHMSIDVGGESTVKAALAPDGQHVLVASCQGLLWWIGLDTDERRLLLSLPASVDFTAIALSADGSQIVAASSDGSIYLGDAERHGLAVFDSGPGGRSSELRFSNDGQKLVSAGQDGWLCVWDIPSGRIVRRWKGHGQPATAAAFVSDDRIISTSLDDTVRIWDVASGREIWRGEFGLLAVTALAVSPDGLSAAWGGNTHKVVVWDIANGRKKCEIEVPASMVRDVKFSFDNKSLAVAAGGTLRVHDAQSGTAVAVIEMGDVL